MGATCTVQTYRNSCKFFSESKKMARVISKVQVSDPGPSVFSIHSSERSQSCSVDSLYLEAFESDRTSDTES